MLSNVTTINMIHSMRTETLSIDNPPPSHETTLAWSNGALLKGFFFGLLKIQLAT